MNYSIYNDLIMMIKVVNKCKPNHVELFAILKMVDI